MTKKVVPELGFWCIPDTVLVIYYDVEKVDRLGNLLNIKVLKILVGCRNSNTKAIPSTILTEYNLNIS